MSREKFKTFLGLAIFLMINKKWVTLNHTRNDKKLLKKANLTNKPLKKHNQSDNLSQNTSHDNDEARIGQGKKPFWMVDDQRDYMLTGIMNTLRIMTSIVHTFNRAGIRIPSSCVTKSSVYIIHNDIKSTTIFRTRLV